MKNLLISGFLVSVIKATYMIPPLTSMSCPNYSPTFPSEGGADCSYRCANGTRSVGTAFFDIFPDEYTEKITEAGNLVYELDPENTVYVEGDDGFMNSHISFSYYCCYGETDLDRIRSVLDMIDWQPHEVGLSYTTCAVDGPSLDHVSFIIMLDAESNAKMMQWVAAVEEKIRDAGVRIHVPRIKQEPYHSTLAVVNGSAYPIEEALQALNDRFPSGNWTKNPITLQRPCRGSFFC